MGKLRPFCHTCQRSYRGLYGIHASTASHRMRVARKENRGRDVGRKRPASSLNSARLSIARLAAADAAMVSVVKHRRRPPDDGPRFVVKVKHYWRREPYVSSRTWPPPTRRRARARG